MITYKKLVDEQFVAYLKYIDGELAVSIPEAPGNRHYEEYLEWLAEGNEPEVIEA